MIGKDPRERLPGLRILRDVFLAMDGDFVQTFRYVEPVRENLNTYSVEFMRLLQTACTGIDSTFRLWYRYIAAEESKFTLPRASADDLKFADYLPLLDVLQIDATRDLLLERNPKIAVAPFREWKSRAAIPQWWTAHNKTKHELNDVTFKGATLAHALDALGGFYLALSDGDTKASYPVWTDVFKRAW